MKTTEESVVSAMDGDNTEIFPYLPYILQDFWEIGTSPEEVITLIEKHIKNPSELHVLDLGCGKGAVSIRLSERFGCKCFGIDAIKEFIEEAGTKAKEYHVDALCLFKAGDIRDEIKTLEQFDVIISGAVGPVFGNHGETLITLQPHLKENGYVIIDDGYLEDDSDFEYPRAVRRKDLFTQIASANMMLVDEIMQTDEDDKSGEYDKQLEFVKKRCYELISKYPEKKYLFEGYINSQKQEYENLEQNLILSILMITNK
ncbi:MAG: class I SAM-dependent methyltransferase [Tannerella sp.]|jgi:SAM-dependent methyltransferase|nr:class I SAM-dependent methyltransferase [Tannerella sp.]